MGVVTACRDHPETVILRLNLSEHFDFRSIHSFRNLYTEKSLSNVEVVVDMSATRYIDSSGIALLECLRHWIKAPKATVVRITNCCPQLHEVLLLSKLSHTIAVG